MVPPVKMEKRQTMSKILYCVTGATGYIGSWLVKNLLDEGFTVHATVRDPEKATWLLSSMNNQAGQLRLFKANLHEDGSFDEAVKDCHGVFHVAASMEFNISEKQNIESYAQSNIIDPSIKGTLNLLKSCLRSNSVKRVVFTSSISTLTAKENDGNWKSIVDESCQTPIDHVWRAKASGWVYVLSKLLAEEAAFKFAKENGIDLVSVITPTVAGPFLTSTVPSSIRAILSPITGDQSFYSILSTVSSRMGSIALIHIEDICSAHIFLMQHPAAEGRYISCASTCLLHELRNRLALEHLHRNSERDQEEEHKEGHGSVPLEISSMKLRDLGFRYKHGLDDIIHQTVASCIDHGFLSFSSSLKRM